MNLNNLDYGGRARIGMIIPSGNVIAEVQVRAMVPQGISVHFTRLPLRGSSAAELLAMAEGVESAASLLSDAKVDLIAFNCTAVSTYSTALESDIGRRIESSTGTPSATTGQALVAAMRVLDAKRITLLTPYLEEINLREVAFFRNSGIDVTSAAGLGLNTPGEMAALDPEIWLELAARHDRADSDAILISCTAVRSADVIEALEQRTGKPVVTSNQALTWHALRQTHIDDHVPGFGRLLHTH